jgi:hypothetical protein
MGQHTAPREHLPGDAAGGHPGWQSRLAARVNEDQRGKADRRGAGMRNWPARLTVVCDVQFRVLLRQAANARGISASGYARRAVAAFVAADLGLELPEVCAHLPKPSPAEGNMRGLPREQQPLFNPGAWIDDARGFGTWQVRGE